MAQQEEEYKVRISVHIKLFILGNMQKERWTYPKDQRVWDGSKGNTPLIWK
jgi:hypothetical protein